MNGAAGRRSRARWLWWAGWAVFGFFLGNGLFAVLRLVLK